ncbi:hypothetical protein ACQKGD_27605 [Peribacillus frigoritolerans]|uniref:hypothetical protein n=1 Tax=Peribacillus frigoritolerans TaxID=450367 RepID=UPI003D05CC34
MENNLVLNESNLKKIIKIMMAEADIASMATLAKEIGIKDTTFRSALNNDSLRVKELIALSDKLGFEITLKARK